VMVAELKPKARLTLQISTLALRSSTAKYSIKAVIGVTA